MTFGRADLNLTPGITRQPKWWDRDKSPLQGQTCLTDPWLPWVAMLDVHLKLEA